MKIELLDSKGVPFSLVRYFNLNNLQLLIYITNETLDEQGRSTIYISKIENHGVLSANVVPDGEWDIAKNIIKDIVNANKNGQPLPVVDLDYNNLEGIQINGSKALKLMSNYVELLKANQPIFEKAIVNNMVNNSEPTGNFENVVTDNVVSFDQNPGMSVFTQPPVFEQQPEPTVQQYQPIPETQAPVFEQPVQNTIYSMNQPFQPVQDSVVTNIQPVQNFNNSYTPSVNDNISATEDYQKLYFEQLELNEQLKLKIEDYENKLNTLKSIINE